MFIDIRLYFLLLNIFKFIDFNIKNFEGEVRVVFLFVLIDWVCLFLYVFFNSFIEVLLFLNGLYLFFVLFCRKNI